MRIRSLIRLALCILPALVLGGLAYAGNIAQQHPVQGNEAKICSKCHTDEKMALDHSGDFYNRHKFHANRQSQVCLGCHRESFCIDCHANKEELTPSDKFKDSPDRVFPHRGDYMSRHKIDGKIYPALCMKCHGRRNNARCKACHR